MTGPYITCGTDIASMLGRRRIYSRVYKKLTKPTPDNISIVGPKLYGKTVFLNYLSERFSTGKENYIDSLYIDLRHSLPESDNEFIKIMAKRIRNALQDYDTELSEILKESDADILLEMLHLVFDTLSENNDRLLIIFDSFDFLPLGTGISPNMLDQLRSLVEKPSICFVTGSRKRLRELCKTEESRTSDFWRIFTDPVMIEAFNEKDWDDLLEPFLFRSIIVDPGAKTELKNQTGGIPLLVTSVLESLYEKKSERSKITISDVSLFCEQALDQRYDIFNELWVDCPLDLQSVISEAAAGNLKKESVSHEQTSEASIKGLAHIEGDFFKIKCRMIEIYAKKMASGVAGLNRLFGSIDAYNLNIRRLLELNLRHHQYSNKDIYRYVKYAINDLADEPQRVLQNARGIVEAALKICMSTEGIRSGDEFPEDWKVTWEKSNRDGVPANYNPIPNDRGLLCAFLRLITGRNSFYPRVAKNISRHTSTLIDQVNTIGNFVNHRDWESPSYGLAYSMCFLAIELLASIHNDLSTEERN